MYTADYRSRRQITLLRKAQSTRHNAVKHDSQLVTQFYDVTSWPCDELTGFQFWWDPSRFWGCTRSEMIRLTVWMMRVFKFLLIVTDWETYRPRRLWRSRPHRPTVKNNSFTLGVVGRYTSTETFHWNILTPWRLHTLRYSCIAVMCEYWNQKWQYMIAWACPSAQPKWHVDRLSCYWVAHCCERSTDRPTIPSVKDFPSEIPSHSLWLVYIL